jgi:hypothetical protein
VKGEEEKIAVYDMTEWIDASVLQIHTRREWMDRRMEENHCFIYCVDISKDEQMMLDDFAKLRAEVQQFGKKPLSEMPLLVVGMKSDLNQIDSSSFLLRLLHLSVNDFPHLESICCSAQTGENVERVFFHCGFFSSIGRTSKKSGVKNVSISVFFDAVAFERVQNGQRSDSDNRSRCVENSEGSQGLEND